MAIVAIFCGPVPQVVDLLAQSTHLLSMLLDHGVLLTEQCLLLPNQFVSLSQVFSLDLLLFSHSEQFCFIVMPVLYSLCSRLASPCGPGLLR